ncbi:MAG: GNAT family N-acetyltransferase [Candidatus Gracilibacteria bacterium]
MIIHKAKPEDAVFISKINSMTWLSTYKSDEYGINENIFKENQTSEKDKDKFIKRKNKEILDNPGSYFLVRDKNKVIGYASGKLHKEKQFNEFFAIYILPEYQGMGIGKKLANKVFAYLGNKKNIIVEVIGYNKNAILFYENLGFKFNKKLEDFEIIDGIWVPEIQMIKKGK